MFTDYMTIYTENLKESTMKITNGTSHYITIAGYKVNTWKSIALLYISNEQVEFEFKNIILFTLAPKNEILRYSVNLSKYAQDQYEETTKLS